MKILISGFTTFSTHTENSSQVMTELLKDTQIDGFKIKTVILPVAFSNAFDHLKVEIDNFKPDVVLCLGLAHKREVISIEKVAINFMHCGIPDNEGVNHQDQPILEHGPAAFFSTLPLRKMREVTTPFPVEISYSAGAYVCNYVMYRLMDDLKGTSMKGGFIHLPELNNDQEAIHKSLVSIIQVMKS